MKNGPRAPLRRLTKVSLFLIESFAEIDRKKQRLRKKKKNTQVVQQISHKFFRKNEKNVYDAVFLSLCL